MISFKTHDRQMGVWAGWYLVKGHYVKWRAPDECYDLIKCIGIFCVYC